jgi:hypothetical protein
MKKTNITLSIALAAVFSASTAFAEAEVTGKIVHESAKFTTSGTTIGAATAHDKDIFKTETSARIYIDGDADELQDGATYHVELNLMRDSKGVGEYDGNESYTQRDVLREAYIDMEQGDWSIRAGKQQVVWGTADGMKLLDMINPTDYSEMAQNQMEDSRIPVWMVNAETTNADGSEFQVVVSQAKENVFAGFNRHADTSVRGNNANLSDGTTADSPDQGNPFVMKGVDTVTGKTNGFLNGVPDLGSMATQFSYGFGGGGPSAPENLYGGGQVMTVGMYAGNSAVSGMPTGFNGDGAQIMYGMATTYYDFNLTDSVNAAAWNAGIANPSSMFEYMDRAKFATFDAFSGAKSQLVHEMPEDSDVNIATRYKTSTADGVNYTLNYSYNYDTNPVIDLSWRNDNGDLLITNRASNDVLTVTNLAGTVAYGAGGYSNATSGAVAAGGAPTLRFTETMKRAHNIGGSFDTAIETAEFGPVVIRGEGLYQKDVYTPVFDRGLLAIGDLPGALTMRKGDRMKFVLGADITVMTNMMVSAQIIQDRNLDYFDNNVDYDGTTCTVADGANCGVYTGDFATMHMSNGFNKAEENKEFYSLFFSKPFGASGEHRWNNILMLEENGGKWNRLDAEFSIDDNTQATVEYNKYWGNENTQFGQLEAASNIQVGVKYSF